ncbi:hypothetical protein HEP87_61635 [Streptomyces sp. S1D4-11]
MTVTPDIDLTTRPPNHHTLRNHFLAADSRLFKAIASRHWPGCDPFLPKLSRSANHGLLWFATAAALTATRTPTPAEPPQPASPPSPSPPPRSTPWASARCAAPARPSPRSP